MCLVVNIDDNDLSSEDNNVLEAEESENSDINIYISMMVETIKITPIIEFNLRSTLDIQSPKSHDYCVFYRPEFCIFNTFFIRNSKELDRIGPVVIQE